MVDIKKIKEAIEKIESEAGYQREAEVIEDSIEIYENTIRCDVIIYDGYNQTFTTHHNCEYPLEKFKEFINTNGGGKKMASPNYYRQTEWTVDAEDWFEHNKKKGIPTLLVRNPKNGLQAVFVEGKEENVMGVTGNSELINGMEVIRMYKAQRFNGIKIVIIKEENKNGEEIQVRNNDDAL